MSDRLLSRAKEKAISLLQYWGQDHARFTGRINRLQSQADVVREIEEYFDGGQQAGPYQAYVITVRFEGECFYPIALAMLFLYQRPLRCRFTLVFRAPNLDHVSNDDVGMLQLVVRYFPIVSVEFVKIPICLAAKLPEIFSEPSQTITSLYLCSVSGKVLECVTDLVVGGKFPKVDSIIYVNLQATFPGDDAGQFVRLLSDTGLQLARLDFNFDVSMTENTSFFAPDDFERVMSAMKQHQRSLKRLRLIGGVLPADLPCILDAAKGLLHIDTVDLSYNHSLVDDHAKSIMSAIRGHRSLKYVDLYGTQITEAKRDDVARVLAVSHALRSQILVALMSALSIQRLREGSPLRVLSVELVRCLGLFLGQE